jgi:hypothetical protein
MAGDRERARQRVKRITAWAAGGAAALTAGFAFGAAHGNHTASATASPRASDPSTTTQPPATGIPDQQPDQSQSQGFTPPSSSSQPPSAMSGGS